MVCGGRGPEDLKPKDASTEHAQLKAGQTGNSWGEPTVLLSLWSSQHPYEQGTRISASVRQVAPLLRSPPLCFETSTMRVPNQLLITALQESRLCLAKCAAPKDKGKDLIFL